MSLTETTSIPIILNFWIKMEHWFDELSTLSAFFSNSSRGTRDSRLCLTRNCILWRLVLRRKVLSTYSLSWRGELSPPPSQSLILISPRDWRGTKKGVNHYSSLQCWTLYISFRIHEVFLFEKGRSFVFFSLIEIEVLIQRNECGRKRREIYSTHSIPRYIGNLSWI